MRLLYVAVVASLVSMILIGSYLNTPAGIKRALNGSGVNNMREFGDIVKKGDVLFGIFRKYKTEMWQLLPVKKVSANGHGQGDVRSKSLLSS